MGIKRITGKKLSLYAGNSPDAKPSKPLIDMEQRVFQESVNQQDYDMRFQRELSELMRYP